MLSEKITIIPRKKHIDDRGWLVKPVDGTERGIKSFFGEIYVTSANPGKSKGGDYSLTTNKWFAVIEGYGTLKLEDVETKEKLSLALDGKSPVTVYVPCGVANLFINEGKEPMVIIAYADKKYDKNDIVKYKL